jgi:hypothetical protein
MHGSPTGDETQRQALCELLLGYLRAANVPAWPGADGLTVHEVLATYPQASSAGQVPNLEQLLRERSDLQEELIAFFAGHDRPR